MEKNRTYFKNLLAEHALDILYDELFALMEAHQSGHPDKVIAEKHDELVLLSGKMNSVQQSHQMGTISPGELNITATGGKEDGALTVYSGTRMKWMGHGWA